MDWASMIDRIPSGLTVRLRPQAVWACLERLDMSQNTLARRIGVTQGFLSLLMNGRRSPSARTMRSLMKELDATFDELFDVVARETIRRELARTPQKPKSRSNGRGPGKQFPLPGLEMMPPGTTTLPDDFPLRLELLKKESGLTWNQFGEKIGINPRQMLRWRKGAKPSGGAMYSLMQFAMEVPNGCWLLCGDLSQPPPNWVEGA